MKRKRVDPRQKHVGPPTSELAEAVGVSEQTIRKYRARGCPMDSVESVMAWRAENGGHVAECAEPGELQRELIRAKIAKEHENTRAQRLKSDKEAGRLIEREEVIRDVHLMLSKLRTRMTSLGTEVANVVPAELKAVIKTTVEEKVRVALKELADTEVL